MEFNFDQEKIQELYPGAVMIPAMKTYSAIDEQFRKACESGEYFGQTRKEGYWYQYERHDSGNYLFAKTISKKTGLLAEKLGNVPHIARALLTLPYDTILVGEIYYPGRGQKAASQIMRCLPPKAEDRQRNAYGLIHYYLFDILMYDGMNFIEKRMDNETRYQVLSKLFYFYKLNEYDFLELADYSTDNLYDKIIMGEDIILKKKTSIYEPDKRSTNIMKISKREDINEF